MENKIKNINKLVELSNVPNNEIYFNTKWLFNNTLGKDLKSADLLVRLLAIDNYFNKNDYGLKLYAIMQEKRMEFNKKIPRRSKNYIEGFINLIKSFESMGYDCSKPVELNKKFEVFDGSHRLACSLAFNIEKIPVKFSNKYIDLEYDYSINWFESNGLGKYKKYIIQKYNDLKRKGVI